MTHQEMLSMAKHFHPHIKNPCMVTMERNEIKEALDKNYRAIDPNVEEDIIAKYIDRGFIRTIAGRYIRDIGEDVIYETLLNESSRDVDKELFLAVNCSTFNARCFICDKEDVKKVCAEVQAIIDQFKWKVPYKVRFGVVYGNETDCT